MAPTKSTKSPAFQTYAADFLGSEKVARMSYTEIGIYWVLLCRAWLGQGLPTDVAEIAKMLRINPAKFGKMWSGVLSECWIERGGRLVNARQEVERQKQREFRRRQADNGKQGGRPNKVTHSKAVGLSGFAKSQAKKSSSSLSSSSDPPIEAPSDDGPHLDVWFLEFAAEYPESRRKTDKLTQDAWLDAFAGVEDVRAHYAFLRERLANHIASEQWAERQVIPSMTKWLAERRWVQTLASSQHAKSNGPSVLSAEDTRKRYLA